jgi:hypothetical protein
VRSLGQDLFAPPNVKGWDGGLTWITTNSLLARYNESATLTQGDLSIVANTSEVRNPNQLSTVQNRFRNFRMGGVNVTRLFTEQERADKDLLLAAIEKRLLQSRLNGRQEDVLRDFLDSREKLDESDIRNAVRLVMSTPEFQLT